MDLTTGELEKIDYEPLLNPRYSSAITVVGDELYILGGRGNKYGKQELVSHFYTELCAIDLKKKKSRVVWRRQQTDAYMLMASSMYFEPSDSSFLCSCTERWWSSMESFYERYGLDRSF